MSLVTSASLTTICVVVLYPSTAASTSYEPFLKETSYPSDVTFPVYTYLSSTLINLISVTASLASISVNLPVTLYNFLAETLISLE